MTCDIKLYYVITDIIALYLFVFLTANSILKDVLHQMNKLVLSTNEVLYLQKQPLVDTLQKYLFYREMLFIKAVALHLN